MNLAGRVLIFPISNGKTPGISHPSAEFQEAVIRKAYATAGLSLAETDYVECHGTATATGDPVEVSAIKKCFTPRNDIPLIIGSVSNIPSQFTHHYVPSFNISAVVPSWSCASFLSS